MHYLEIFGIIEMQTQIGGALFIFLKKVFQNRFAWHLVEIRGVYQKQDH